MTDTSLVKRVSRAICKAAGNPCLEWECWELEAIAALKEIQQDNIIIDLETGFSIGEIK